MLSQTFWRSVCHSTRTGIAHRVIRPGSGLLRAFSSPAEAAADQEVVITERCAAVWHSSRFVSLLLKFA